MGRDTFQTDNGFYCEINQQHYSSIRGLLNYLRTHSISSKDYYLKFLGEIGKCKTCGNPTKFHQINTGYRKYCSNICSSQNYEHRKLISDRFVNNPEKLHNSLQKRKKTLSKKTKDENRSIQDKRISTSKQRYGDYYFSQRTKLQWERRTKEEVDLLVLKANATKRKNGTYSKPYKNTNREVSIKGKVFKVQGYEDIALNLLSEIVDVNEIKIGKDAPRIRMCNGKNYYPDILINNLLIEVKSEYTYNVNLEENLFKQSQAIKSGYDHIFLVIHSRDLNKDRTLKTKDKYLKILHMAISIQASNEEGSTTIP
jgi:hypothetical protein